jgi:Bacterial regulatory protein, Fis family.
MTKPTSPQDDAPLVYDYQEAARLLGVSERTLRRRIDAGEVRRVTVFGMPRIEHEEIMRCIKREVAA